MPLRSRFLLYGLVWLATFLRLPALFQNHFHADEALFASWARLIAVWRDPLLISQAVDKPPLLFYTQALFFPLLGPVEWAARMPNFIVSILLVPLVAVLSWRFYRQPATMVLAASFVTLSPLAIQFSGTGFTDPLLTSFIVVSLIAASERRRPFISGLFFALALVTKYQAILFLPLILTFAWLGSWEWRAWKRWLYGMSPVIILLVLWEIARAGTPVLWANQVANFGGFRFAWSWELWPRFMAWLALANTLWGSIIISGLFLALIFYLFARGWTADDRQSAVDKVLVLFMVSYLLLHWLVAIPIWDRYLLPLIPIGAILMARGLTLCASSVHRLWREKWCVNQPAWPIKMLSFIGLLAILFLMVPGTAAAKDGRWPVGGQPTADQGAWQVADYLAGSPYGTVLYDHWYSWYWAYHLFDKKVYMSWFPHPQALAADLAVFADGREARYLVLPGDDRMQLVKRILENAGFQLELVLETDYDPGMRLYRLESVMDGLNE